MLIITGCTIYCLVKTRRTDVVIPAMMAGMIFAAMLAAGWITCITEDACDRLSAFVLIFFMEVCVFIGGDGTNRAGNPDQMLILYELNNFAADTSRHPGF